MDSNMICYCMHVQLEFPSIRCPCIAWFCCVITIHYTIIQPLNVTSPTNIMTVTNTIGFWVHFVKPKSEKIEVYLRHVARAGLRVQLNPPSVYWSKSHVWPNLLNGLNWRLSERIYNHPFSFIPLLLLNIHWWV